MWVKINNTWVFILDNEAIFAYCWMDPDTLEKDQIPDSYGNRVVWFRPDAPEVTEALANYTSVRLTDSYRSVIQEAAFKAYIEWLDKDWAYHRKYAKEHEEEEANHDFEILQKLAAYEQVEFERSRKQ